MRLKRNKAQKHRKSYKQTHILERIVYWAQTFLWDLRAEFLSTYFFERKDFYERKIVLERILFWAQRRFWTHIILSAKILESAKLLLSAYYFNRKDFRER